MKKLTFGSLFAGIGGFDLGFERAGMVCKWQVEIDSFCQKVLAKHWPDVRRYRDVREVGKHNLEAVDVICGGFPCQPHSTSGKRKGAADDRNLWPEYLRIIAELNPAWVIGENVSGIITTILNDVLFDLEDKNYEVLPFAIPACSLNASHKRERIFIIANATSKRSNTGINTKKYLADEKKERENDVNGISQTFTYTIQSTKWRTKPFICGRIDGIPNRVDRLRALGNAVVPQVAEWIGSRIIQYETDEANI